MAADFIVCFLQIYTAVHNPSTSFSYPYSPTSNALIPTLHPPRILELRVICIMNMGGVIDDTLVETKIISSTYA